MNKYDHYKDSGIEWIGEIPGHWEVKRLKHISDIVLGKMLHSEDKGNMELKPYLRAANLNWLKFDVSDVKLMWFTDSGEIKKSREKGHLSYFEFTGTPKTKTLEIFGSKNEEGQFEAFHTYSMKQSISEGFTLDVLRNYTTYRRWFKITKKTAEDLEVHPSGC